MGEMQDINDVQLLRDYAERGHDAAFRLLVSRHADLVYAAARRQVGSADLAADVAQSVFVDLARKAAGVSRRLGASGSLAGWLHRGTRYAALKLLRETHRRVAHEREALDLILSQPDPSTDWDSIRLSLDEALNALPEADREALLRRYFQNEDLRTIGAALGISDDAAQKRVSRALNRLREHFTRQGIELGEQGFQGILVAHAIEAAPPMLVSSICAALPPGGTALASAGGTGFSEWVGHTRLRLVAVATIAGLLVPALWLWMQNVSLRRELVALRLSAQLGPTGSSAASTAAEPDVADEALRRSQKEHLELLALRGRLAQLTRERGRGNESIPPSDAPPLIRTEPDSILFSVSATNRVPSGQTLVLGGWAMKGTRVYLLVSPSIQPKNDNGSSLPLRFESRIVQASESFWEEIGWGLAASESHRSDLSAVLTAAQAGSLLDLVRTVEGAEVSNTDVALRGEGDYLGLGWSVSDDHEDGILLGIDVFGWIAPDAQTVELHMRPSKTPKTGLHPFLEKPLTRAQPLN